MEIYKTYTIEEDFRNPYSNTPEYMYYPTEEGIQHDGDLDGDQIKYCGNCKWASSLQEAKDEIDEIVWVSLAQYIKKEIQKAKIGEKECISIGELEGASHLSGQQFAYEKILKLL